MPRVALIGGFGDLVVKFRGPLIADLVAAGHVVTVCVPQADPALRSGIAQQVRELGAELVDVPLDRTGTNPLREWRATRFFHDFFRGRRFDVVLAYNPKPIFHALPAAKRAGVPLVAAMVTGLGFAFIGGSWKARALGALARWLYRRALRSADVVFFQNPDDRAMFAQLGLLPPAIRIEMIAGSGVDTNRFAAQPLVTDPAAPIFLMIARLLKDKGAVEFAEAAKIVRRSLPGARFRLLGWIDSNPAAIAQRDLDRWIHDGTVEYAGRVDDVRGELAQASVFVLPSYREGTPKSVLEAMSVGRAIVTTDAPGCRETVIDGENGLLVPVRDAQALARACEQLARDPAMVVRFGRRSRELAETRFASTLVNRRIIAALGIAGRST
ncbi:MAG: glycosyltransferase family 4 protein [Phycisphaerae bacterium]|nr:glycosyltransferase family 4 protein [Phycisphaerae bacterium]